MSKTLRLVTLCAALVAALSAAYFMGYLPKPITELTSTEVISEAPAEQASEKIASEETKPAPLAEPMEEMEPTLESVNIPGAYEYFDEEGISAEAAEEYRELAVLPYNPMVAECEHKWTTHDGRTESVYAEVCTYKRKYPEHPYFDYEIENLFAFTQNQDVLAAAVLAERTKETHPSESLALALYSSFASGKPAQLLDYANSMFPINNVDPKVRNLNLTDHYIFTSIAQRLGHPDADLSFASSIPSEQLSKMQEFAAGMHSELQSRLDANLPFIGNTNPFNRSPEDNKSANTNDTNG